MEGDTLAGQTIDSILDGTAGAGQMAGEGTQTHAGAAEAFKLDEVDEAFGVIVDGKSLDGERSTTVSTKEALHGAEGFRRMAAVEGPPVTFASVVVGAVGVGTERWGEQRYPP